LELAESFERLIALQATDSGLDELEKLKKRSLRDIEALQGGVMGLQARLQAGKKAMEELAKERKTAEIEVGSFETRIRKYQGQESEVKTNEQLAALRHEIEKSQEEKGRAEERVLEILFKEDEQRKVNQGIAAELAEAEKKAAADRKALEEKIADCDRAAKDKMAVREGQLAGLPPDLAEGYTILRKAGKRPAVAEVQEDGTCGGCHMNVPPQTVHQVRKNLAVERCDCGRYLYLKG
jgi:predicted  nucleic acid-binding Zn-ribbon protein